MFRGLISFAVIVVILLAIIGILVGGSGAIDRMIPGRLLAYMDQIGLTSKFGPPPSGTGDKASDFLVDTPNGLEARGMIAAVAGNAAVFTVDAIIGYSTRVANEIPAEITTIRPILGCSLTPPAAGSIVGHVTAGHSDLPLSMATYGDTDLAAAVQVLVNAYRKTGTLQAVTSDELAFQAYDVAVTETVAPVYLVLESSDVNRLWNIHLAPGAQIERVILLGGRQAGVANLDPVVPVEVMLASGLVACGITPTYRLNQENPLFKSLEAGTVSQEEANQTLARIDDAVEKYDTWFETSFGPSAGASRIGWDVGTISIVGPMPQDGGSKALWRPIQGAELRATQASFSEIRGQVADGADFTSRVMAIATTFASGDLTMLRQGVEFRECCEW